MSRHEIPAIDPNHVAFVGWDPALRTFFGQVYDRSLGEEENPILWVGTGLCITEIPVLAHYLERYAQLSPGIQRLLYADRELGR